MTDVTNEQLDAAAGLLMQQLPKGAQELVQILAMDNKVHQWWCVCGILMEAHIAGRLSSMTFDPDWRVGFKQHSGKCGMCHKEFEPSQIGQIYCSNECGSAATLMESLKAYEDQRVVEEARIEAVKLKYPKTLHPQISMAGLVDIDQLITDTKLQIQQLMGKIPTEAPNGTIKAGDDAPIDGSVADKFSGAGNGVHNDVKAAKAMEERDKAAEQSPTAAERLTTIRNRRVQTGGEPTNPIRANT